MPTKVSSAKSYSTSAQGAKLNGANLSAFKGSKISSPADTPEKILSTIGGMPPTKKIEQINKENEARITPGSVYAGN
jgi:hypothetical protein